MSGKSLIRAGLALVLALAAAPAFAQSAEKPGGPSAGGMAGDGARAEEPGTEHPAGGPGAAGEEEVDPSKHFNFVGKDPGHLFDYTSKDEYGGPLGDGQMKDPATDQVVHEEEKASPPFVFVLFNFAILIGLLWWKLWPLGQKVAQERHDLIKTALDEAARLRTQAADKLAEYEARLAAADAQIKDLVDGIRVDAENESKRLLAAAEAQVAQMKRDAEARIAAEIELARAQLTREVTAAATAATEKLLKDKLTTGDQQQLVAGFIADVQTAGPAGRTGQGEVR